MDFMKILEEAHEAASAAHADIKDGLPCGFAWVTVEGNSALARWCRQQIKKADLAYQYSGGSDRAVASDKLHEAERKFGSKGYPGGWRWWCPGNYPGQNVAGHVKAAAAFQAKLAEYGIRATHLSQLD